MARETNLDLIDGFEWHGKREMTLPINEPNGRQYAEYGNPRILVYNSDGAAYHVDQTPVIQRYAEALIGHEGGKLILPLLSLADAMLVRGAILGFFTAAEATIASRNATSSSSP